MKQLLGLIIVFFVIVEAYAQTDNKSLKINDDWFRNYGNKGLQVGDAMPDIPLGTMLNDHTGKTSFTDFRGKLVILDFWATTCSSCIEDFPYMENLQRQFGDKIQVLLVNTFESKQQIQEKWIERYKIKMPDLPSLVADQPSDSFEDAYRNSAVYRLFPYRRLGQHVWIDGKGIIRLIGGHMNTHPEKIADLLAGKEITFLNDNDRIPEISEDRKTPYYKQLGSLQSTPVVYGSFITPYNNELSGSVNYIVDSVYQTMTTYFINLDLVDIYEHAFNGLWKKTNIFYSPLSLVHGDLAIFPPGTDTLNFTSYEKLLHRRATDKDYLKAKYCYEQVTPMHMPYIQRQQYMVEDLNRFFKERLGVTAALEKRKIPCYSIVRISKADKIEGNSGVLSGGTSINAMEEKGRRLKKYTSVPFEAVIQLTIPENPNLQSFLEQNKRNGKPFLLINETGWDRNKKVDMVLPAGDLNTIEDMKKVLKQYDLDIVEKEGEVELIVFKKN